MYNHWEPIYNLQSIYNLVTTNYNLQSIDNHLH